jgi:hypothetical protein
MNLKHCSNATFLVAVSLILRCSPSCLADDAGPTHQLSLTDLAKYRAALAGKATADDVMPIDLPVHVSFKDLWNRPDAFRGHHVVIEGRVQRIFRQGPLGGFPALAEIWIASPAGDPFCLVIPHQGGIGSLAELNNGLKNRAPSERIPKLGQMVRFTGTFLKMIRYEAGDGDRLAPLVVGDQPPVTAGETVNVNRASSFADNTVGWQVGSAPSWLLLLTLALLAAGIFAWQHSHASMQRSAAVDMGHRNDPAGLDPFLEFIEPHDNP